MRAIKVFCDFDGTITRQDTTDAVLEAFADPQYRVWEQKWEEGSITAVECMEKQTRLMTADPEALRSFLAHITVDPGIYDLKRRCKENGATLVVLSDGIDFLLDETLRARGLDDLPRYANRLRWDKRKRPTLTFPYRASDCDGGCGVCKCRFLLQGLTSPPPPAKPDGASPSTLASARCLKPQGLTSPTIRCGGPCGPPPANPPQAPAGAFNVYIGDGLSDRCVVRRADRVFAKKRLQDYCLKEGIVHEPFETLSEVAEALFGSNQESG